jgi:putative endonuclease
MTPVGGVTVRRVRRSAQAVFRHTISWKADNPPTSAHNRPMQPCIYILASGYNGTLYIGVTSALVQRIWQHREGVHDGFTKKHGIRMLVHYELLASMEEAIRREKQLKHWNRDSKIRLIEQGNPDWRDLYPDIAV